MTAKTSRTPRRCLCGCNGEVGKRATFVPGHDSKLHSRWLQVKRRESKERLTREQIEYGDSHWEVTERKPKPAKVAKGKAKAAKGGKGKVRGTRAAIAAKRSPAQVAAEEAEAE